MAFHRIQLQVAALYALLTIPVSMCASCQDPPRPPPPASGQECQAACTRREQLGCGGPEALRGEACVAFCAQTEARRPGVLHTVCVARSLDCPEMDRCGGEGVP